MKFQNDVFVTAEIGINHNGDIDIAKKLIDMAKICGCDAVKFQKRTVEKVYTEEFLNSPRESPWGKTQREQKNGLEFGQKEYDEIDSYCQKVGIDWYASAWDIESQLFLQQYNLKYNKIASAMVSHSDVVEEVAREGKQTFISTGKVDIDQLDAIVEVFEVNKTPYTLLHCVTKYPCLDGDCNLKRIRKLQERYGRPVGYSNHSPGSLPCAIAVSLGAEALETHICLDRTAYGTDMPASMEFTTLHYVVRDAQRIHEIIGG